MCLCVSQFRERVCVIVSMHSKGGRRKRRGGFRRHVRAMLLHLGAAACGCGQSFSSVCVAVQREHVSPESVVCQIKIMRSSFNRRVRQFCTDVFESVQRAYFFRTWSVCVTNQVVKEKKLLEAREHFADIL